MKKIFSVDGSKGGTGKSSVCMGIIDTVLQAGEKVLVIEADTENADVYKCYKNVKNCEVQPLKIDNVDGFMLINQAVYDTDAKYIVFNNPARSSGWREFGKGFVDSLPKIPAEITTFWVANRKADTIQSLKLYNDTFPQIPIVFVYNLFWREKERFVIWNESNLRKELQKKGLIEVTFPDVADRVDEYMHANRMAWNRIEEMPFGVRMEAERIRRDFTETFSKFLSK